MSAEAISEDTDIHFDANISPSKAINSFYFVKYPRYEDPELNLALAEAEERVLKRNRSRFQLNEELTIKLAERVNMISQLKDKKKKSLKRNDVKSQQGKLYSAHCVNRGRDADVNKLTNKENNDLLSSLLHRMPHGSKTLVDEKKLLRRVKDVYVTGEQLIEIEEEKPPILYSYDCCWRRDYDHGIRPYFLLPLNEIKEEKNVIGTKIKHLEGTLKAIEKSIRLLRKELAPLNALRGKAYDDLLQLLKRQERSNASYFENQSLFIRARELAGNKDISALEELSYTGVEKFMSEWNRSNTFRNTYNARLSPNSVETSLDSNQTILTEST